MQNDAGKKIYYRITFRTVSALSVGSGENRYSDDDIVRDSIGEPFIPGSSLAGVYRSFFSGKDADYYFGTARNETDGSESRVLVYDAKLRLTGDRISSRSVVRDCVALDKWKTAKDGSKFDFEVVEPGAEFVTYLEQNCRSDDKDIGEELADIWKKGQIYIGRKTMRGLGQTGKVTICRKCFDMSKPEELAAWLDFDMYREDDWAGADFEGKSRQEEGADKIISIRFMLKQKGGISIRRYTTTVNSGTAQPDAEQLTCILGQDGKEVPYIPGSSWAGAFRHHMEQLAPGYMEECFGKEGQRSLIRFGESFIQGATPKVLTRNAIDRFTAGVVETALFTEKMWYGGETTLQIELPASAGVEFRQALAASLVDLHMGILSVGGLTAVGRGIFEGKSLYINDAPVPVNDEMYGEILEKLGER